MKKLITVILLLVVLTAYTQTLNLHISSMEIIESVDDIEIEKVQRSQQTEIILTPYSFEIRNLIWPYTGYVEEVIKDGNKYLVLTNTLGTIKRLSEYEPEITISTDGVVRFIIKVPGNTSKVEYIYKRKTPLTNTEKEILSNIIGGK